jgi:hypothetical protein
MARETAYVAYSLLGLVEERKLSFRAMCRTLVDQRRLYLDRTVLALRVFRLGYFAVPLSSSTVALPSIGSQKPAVYRTSHTAQIYVRYRRYKATYR